MSVVSDKIAKIIVASDIAHQWATNAPDEVVATPNGPLLPISAINEGLTDAVLEALTATSATPVTAGIGNKTFAIQAGKLFKPGQPISLSSATIVLFGTVISYTGTALAVNVRRADGTGVASAWQISFSGNPGVDAVASAAEEKLITEFPWD